MLEQEEESLDPIMGVCHYRDVQEAGSGSSATGEVSSPVHCMSLGLPNHSSLPVEGTCEKIPTDAVHAQGWDRQKAVQKGEAGVQLKP